MEQQNILDFIHRRFQQDNHWADGNCYWAAFILCTQFDLTICYESGAGHFVAADLPRGRYYDAFGAYTPKYRPIPLENIMETDALWYASLMRCCRD